MAPCSHVLCAVDAAAVAGGHVPEFSIAVPPRPALQVAAEDGVQTGDVVVVAGVSYFHDGPQSGPHVLSKVVFPNEAADPRMVIGFVSHKVRARKL